MATIPPVKLVLSLKNPTDTEGYINLRVNIPGSKSRYKHKSTGYKVPVSLWLPDEELVSKRHDNHGVINHQIWSDRSDLIFEFTKDLQNKVDFTEAHIMSRLNPKKKTGNFITFYREYINYLATKYTEGYIRHFDTECNTLVRFAGEGLQFSEITFEFLQRYEMSLKVKPTTKHTKVKRLKEVIKLAIKRGYITHQQIDGYKNPRYVAPEKTYLTLAQVEKIEEKLYGGEFNADPVLHDVATFFLLECTSGIRFSDWGRFTIQMLTDSWSLKLRTQKTKSTISLPLGKFPKLKRVIEYIQANNLKFAHSERVTNPMLKDLAKICGIHINITTHTGRHTFATIMLEKRFSMAFISQCMGISIRQVETYAKATGTMFDAELEDKDGI